VKKSKTYGIIGSVVSLILLFLLLWFITLSKITKVEDEGIVVSFGDSNDGSGRTETPLETPSTPPPAPKTPTPKAVKQDLMTQTDESLALEERKRKEKEKEKREQERALQETIRQQQEAIRQQQLEQERKTAEKKRKEQEAIEKANAAMGGFGNNSSVGSGTGSGTTNQGNPLGKGNSGGNSWSLSGRSLTGRLVSPSYDKDVEGKITVNIRVNESGSVISATIGSPTTISDAQTRNAAISAAKSTRFSSGREVSSGSITYNFKLN
jgi:TonB family protein